LPTTNDESDGFYRRFFIIDFPNQFTKTTDIIATIPEIEFSNLANKVCKLLPELLAIGEIFRSGNIDVKRRRYVESSNPLNLFLKDFYDVDAGCFVKSNELFNEYKKYLIKHRKRVVKLPEFKVALENEGFFVVKAHRKSGVEIDNRGYEVSVYENTYWIDGLRRKQIVPIVPFGTEW
jgi:phage/plasmid-associated DNA primase